MFSDCGSIPSTASFLSLAYVLVPLLLKGVVVLFQSLKKSEQSRHCASEGRLIAQAD